MQITVKRRHRQIDRALIIHQVPTTERETAMNRDTEDLRIFVLRRNHNLAVYKRQQQQIAEHQQYVVVSQSLRKYKGETPIHQQPADPSPAPQYCNCEIHYSGGFEDADFKRDPVQNKTLWTPDQQCCNPESLHTAAVDNKKEQITKLETENNESVTPLYKYDCIAKLQRKLREESNVLKAALARTQSELDRRQLEWQEKRANLKQSLSDIQHTVEGMEETLETRMNLLTKTISVLKQQMNKPKKLSAWQRFKALFKRH